MRRVKDLADRLRVYLVTDDRPDHEEVQDIVARALLGGVTCVQLRRKSEDGGPMLRLALALRELTRAHGALFIVNDRLDIALLSEADGVHVGQTDLPARLVKSRFPGLIVGVSARSVDEAVRAEADGADYLGVGSVYPTSTKGDAVLTGLETLQATRRAVHIPIVGIGGITVERAAEVVAAGAEGVAVVSAIMSASDPQAAAEALARQTAR
ncbi:thiamine phosphate synthase [Alicyclobacillus vulcanalis]|uniref:Thiamine-phosphate synthase n=1 Tax=Alicyclobacillus vulcanalis TaxID=252246 RepID=A0A1N7KW51_9BACL|nr:thiamine phosphate synthase [Alicyclobacillus vulcanalis]SIS65828.1 thiamine-phosphate diphosphorylase [Alicyclobacillus vulcanalis]